MLKLNAIKLLDEKGISKYKLFNKLNQIRATKGESLMNYKIGRASCRERV